jgi:type IV/VI secretion system ImpK/VasF family protein
MTLMEVCEPLFQYICRLNRMCRKGGQQDMPAVRAEITSIFAEMKASVARDPTVAQQYEKVELPLLFFVDSLISESKLSFARQWNDARMAVAINELAGDEKFYVLLEETLKDPGAAATERLLVYYTCLGLGFTGWYKGDAEYIRKRMQEIAARARNYLAGGELARICPEAYEHVDTRNLIEPPSRHLGAILIAFVGLLLMLFVINAYLYRAASTELSKSLQAIIAPTRAAPGTDTTQIDDKP